MGNTIKSRSFALLLAAAAVLSSCRDYVPADGPAGDGLAEVCIRVSLQAEQEGCTGNQTKAIIDTEDPACIRNLWVVQYNGVSDAATLMGSGSYLSSFSQDGLNMVSQSKIVPSSGQCTIFFIANSFDKSMVFPKTLGEMKNLSVPTPAQEWLLGFDDTDRHVIFTGWTTVPEIKAGTQIDVTLRRNVAKIILHVTNDSFNADPKVTIHSVRLGSIPTVSYYFPTYSSPSIFPPSGTLTTSDYQSVEWTVPGQGTASVSQDFCFYVPVNMRGTAVNDKQADKAKFNPGKATYAVLECTYFQDDGDIPINYTFFLGANLTNDFNIESNKSYTYNIDIRNKGTIAGDTRIEDYGTVDYSLPEYERANCYMLNPPAVDGIWRSFKIPVDRINVFWGKTSSDYEYQENYHLDSSSEWEAYVIWADFGEDRSKFRFKNGDAIYSGQGVNPFVVQVKKGASGNVVIGVRRKSGSQYTSCLWSWHLWITGYSPDDVKKNSVKPVSGVYDYGVTGGNVHHLGGTMWTTGVLKNGFIMDRDLGALDTDYHKADTPGVLKYQFGRKDPMYKSAVTFHAADGDPIAYSISNPATFITTSSSQGWTSGNKYNPTPHPSSVIIWQDPTATPGNRKKSIFDPCPPGWKVPERGVYSDFNATTFVMGTLMRIYRETMKMPFSGWWTYNSSGVGGIRDGDSACCWYSDSTPNSNGIYMGYFLSSINPSYSNQNRGYGYTVRCVTE